MRGLRGAEGQFTGSEGQVLRAGSFSFQGRVYGVHRTRLWVAQDGFTGCTSQVYGVHW
jgi:hypothetical protein